MLQLFPGIQAQTEGMSLLQVRGGDPGQNQYLLDNVPLLYVNHLGGFMSVFNPDMINAVDVYKGNFPASKGGKISSVIDITQREGNKIKHHGSFSVGVTDLSFAFEGPLFQKKGSYIVTARKTLTEIPLYFANVVNGNDSRIVYGFHDVNAKFTWQPDKKNSFHLNVYTGDDYFFYWVKDEHSRHTNMWGNWLGSLKWSRIFDNGLYSENIFSFNRYRHSNRTYFEDKSSDYVFRSKDRSSVKDYSLRSLWKYNLLRKWDIEFGGLASYLIYEPDYVYRSNLVLPTERILYPSFEGAVYLDNKIELLPALTFQPSFRLTGYLQDSYSSFHFEPRIGFSYNFLPQHSFHLNYMAVSQYSHLVFTLTDFLQKEVFLPVTNDILPETSQQLSANWSGYFYNKMFEVDLSIYYKEMENLISLKEGYENMPRLTHLENKIEKDGTGTAYGAEIMLKKNKGKNTGFISYSYSHVTRKFANFNQGNPYNYEYNRPHNVSVSYNRELSKKWTMSFVWVYQSGFLYTPAIGKQYTISQHDEKKEWAIIYGEKNSKNLPAYHRLDAGINYTTKNKNGNAVVWTFSIYNLYNRQNTSNLYYDNDNDIENVTDISQALQLYRTTYFPVIPSIAYKVYFDYGNKDKKEKTKKNWLYMD